WRTGWIALAILGLGGVAIAQPNVDQFIDFSTDGVPGRLFVPDQAADSARPVIVFLHGAGETGNNNTSQVNGNIDNLLAAAQDRGAFIYAPQATTFGWNSVSRTNTVMSMVEQIFATQNADSNRLYVTGLSMGGGGTWNLGNRYSDQIAALVPIAGINPSGDFDGANLVDIPTWAFHARNDNVVNRSATINTVNRILDAAGEPRIDDPGTPGFEFRSDNLDLAYTQYSSGGHGIWGRVYETPEVYDWMFARAVPEPASFGPFILALMVCVGWLRRRQLDA
ncbi:MAG: alpha/beta fold hydrolase, partial [Planctomycetota bacterium]